MAHVLVPNNIVQLKDMRDAQVGVIHKWSVNSYLYEGWVVQRYNDDLIAITGNEKKSWPGIFKGFATSEAGLTCKVEILQKGSVIQL